MCFTKFATVKKIDLLTFNWDQQNDESNPSECCKFDFLV